MHAKTNSDTSERQSILTDVELIAISEEVSSYFPRPIPETLITLMEVDPYTIHAYWNIEPSRMESILDTFDDDALESSLTLRVHTKRLDAQNRGDGFFDCAIQGMQSSTYVNVTPETSYVAEIGVRAPDGDFLVLAKSNEVVTPPDYQSLRRPVHIDGEDTGVPEHQKTQAPTQLISDKWLDAALTNSEETDMSTLFSVSPPEREGRESVDKGVFYTGGERTKEGLNVNIEIRAFGRVNPVQGLTIAGEHVTIRPDGSFNHRIPFKSKEDIVSLLKIELDETIDD